MWGERAECKMEGMWEKNRESEGRRLGEIGMKDERDSNGRKENERKNVEKERKRWFKV